MGERVMVMRDQIQQDYVAPAPAVEYITAAPAIAPVMTEYVTPSPAVALPSYQTMGITIPTTTIGAAPVSYGYGSSMPATTSTVGYGTSMPVATGAVGYGSTAPVATGTVGYGTSMPVATGAVGY